MLTGFAEPYSFGRRVNKLLKNKHKHYDSIIVMTTRASATACSICRSAAFLSSPPFITPSRRTPAHRVEIGAALVYARLDFALAFVFEDAKKCGEKTRSYCDRFRAHSRRDIARDFSIHESEIDLIYCGIDTAEFHPIPHIQKIPFRLMCTASADQPLKGLKFY